MRAMFDNVWFMCYLLACVNMMGWFLLFSQMSTWRRIVILATGAAMSMLVAIALPYYAVMYLGYPAMLGS